MSSAKLVIEMADATGSATKYSYNYADTEASAQSVKDLISAMITNGSIFEKVPVAAKGAKMVVTTETEVNISE